MTELIPMPITPEPIPEECEGFVLAHWNKDFLCYCFSCDNGDPLIQVVADARVWPHHPMKGFLGWYSRQWRRFMSRREPEWRHWTKDYRAHWRMRHAGDFSDWLWLGYGESHVGAAAQQSEPEEK